MTSVGFRIATLFLGAIGVPAVAAPVTLPMGTEIALVTAEPLSTKVNVKGDLVKLRTAGDLRVGDEVAIPAGTEAVGQVFEARAKGAMGMNGKLAIRPLYLQWKGVTVRLTGIEREKASVAAGAVVGMVALGTPLFTGRSAAMPEGTAVPAMVERTVTLDR